MCATRILNNSGRVFCSCSLLRQYLSKWIKKSMKNWSSHQRFRPNFYLHRRKWNQLQEWSLVDPTETNGLSWTKHKKLDFHAGLVTSDSLLCRRKRSLSFGIPRCLRSILPSILEIKHLLRIHASTQTQFSVWGSLESHSGSLGKKLNWPCHKSQILFFILFLYCELQIFRDIPYST